MTNEDQIVALFARANPVPSLDLLDPVEALDMEHLAHLSARSSEMADVETIELRPEGPSPRPRLALAVAMTVIALVALGILVNRESGVASPVSVATALMDALAKHDGDAALALFSPDGTFFGKYPSDLPVVSEWDRAVGWAEINQGCEEISTDTAGTLVACPFIRQTDWILALGLEPVTNNVYEILVAEGQIQSVVETDNGKISRDGMREAARIFHAWVVANHPDDVATMYKNGDSWRADDPESIALYENYTDEFVTEMESGVASAVPIGDAFMNALADLDGNAALEILAPDARFNGLSPLSNLPAALDLDRATGVEFMPQGCEDSSAVTNGILVVCPYLVEDAWTQALGFEPLSGDYAILVAEGQIKSAMKNDHNGYEEDPWITFRNWIEENHPDHFATMYNSEGGARLDPESIALYDRYTDEFVVSLGG